jgi:phosphoserine phosphatase RsbU/P
MDPERAHLLPLFANLPGSAIDTLSASSQECHFQAGEILFEEGSSSNHVYLVLDGEVEIIKSLGTADERCVAISGKGAILGEMSLFTHHGAHTASVRAHTTLNLLRIPAAQFSDIMHAYPKLTHNLLSIFTRRMEDSENLTIQDLREKNRQLTQAYHDLQMAQAAMIEKEKLEYELHMAGKMQRDILPDILPLVPGVDIGTLMVPARQVGGDFFDILQLDEDHVGIVVGDVCDKGMPAALFMALTYSSMRAEAYRHRDPASTLRAVNRHLLQINRSSMFVTLLYGILNQNTLEFTYARAGHTIPLLLDAHNQMINLPFKVGQPLGIFDDFSIDESHIQIPKGGTLLIYSDGLSETLDNHPESNKLPVLCSRLLKGSYVSAQELCNQLWRTAGGTLDVSMIEDDFTVLALRTTA